MKRKGFTLVELLAVIAILAILVIIALPNVLKLYNNAKKNTFLTEAKSVYKEAINKYIRDRKGSDVIYCKSMKDEVNPLNLSGRNIYYYVKADINEETGSIIVWDNERYVMYKCNSLDPSVLNTANPITDDIKNATCDNILEKSGLEEKLDKNVKSLLNTSWKLNENDYTFSTSNDKMTDLPVINLDFIANGQKYIGIDSAYLPFPIPSVNLELTFCDVKAKSTKTALEKINFPFGTTIEATNGIIGYVISDTDGIYVPYYQKSGWYNDNDRVLNITGGEDIEIQEVIDWFKTHGERVK